MHAQDLVEATGARLSTVYDPVVTATRPLGELYGCRVADSPEDALREPCEADVVSFVSAVRDGTPVLSTFDDGYSALVLAEAALASSTSGSAVKVASIG